MTNFAIGSFANASYLSYKISANCAVDTNIAMLCGEVQLAALSCATVFSL